ncbi:MAG: hypothetical protein JNK35_02145 [Phycisphaerae bacterium]|nr:hypothetical protein [Phycisphaerae bacterium]
MSVAFADQFGDQMWGEWEQLNASLSGTACGQTGQSLVARTNYAAALGAPFPLSCLIHQDSSGETASRFRAAGTCVISISPRVVRPFVLVGPDCIMGEREARGVVGTISGWLTVRFGYQRARAAEPCSADFDGSGSVDPDDISDFIGAYFAGSLAANFNLDCGVDPDDLSDFIAAYFLGCG